MEMGLIRGWEKQYSPYITGGLRLSKARLYREIGEEDGIRDEKEGEIRVNMPVSITRLGGDFSDFPVNISIQIPNEPAIEVEDLMSGERREVRQEHRVEDAGLNDSPFLLCLSREPNTKHDWDSLRTALPERYDAWTVTRDIDALQFEVECGIKRWMALHKIFQHQITSQMGWIAYSYDTTPPASEPDDLSDVKLNTRWFQKNRKYRDQQEYRLAWTIRSPQMEAFPDAIYIELTKTGIALFEPWEPTSFLIT